MSQSQSSRGRALVAALAVLATAGATSYALARLDAARNLERATNEAQASALRATDALRAQLSSLEVQIGNAATNPRLVAALDAGVDTKTLIDLLMNEPWWEPFRRAVDGHGLVRTGTTAEIAAGLPAGLELGSLITGTRANNRATSALRVAGGEMFLVAASPVALPGRSEQPVLLASKSLGVAALAAVAARAGGVVALSDGRRLLASAGSAGGVATGEDFAELRRLSAQAGPATDGSLNRHALAVVPIGNDLRLVVRIAAPGPGGGTLPWPVWATAGIGVLAAIGTFMRLKRRPIEIVGEPVPAGRRPSTLTTVGRYAVVTRIGGGGMAEIYAAVSRGEEGFRRPVVIKRLRPELADDAGAVAQFCDEANLLAALHHPNIVGVQDFGRAGDELFLAEEYVLGRNLGRLVERSFSEQGHAPPAEVVAYVCHELLEALEYAHNMRGESGQPLGIVHRDISPENIMVSARGEVKLLDFGVVKAAEGRASKTDFGVIKGNVMFMSPEQARGLEVDNRADVYALALVMYFALTGRPLYRSQTTYGLLLKAGSGPDMAELAAAKDIPLQFRPILQRALAPQLEERYQTAREMAADLQPLMGDGARGTVSVMARLFGNELEKEARQLATFVPGPSQADAQLT